MILDKQGRLFGRVSVIDLVLLVVVIGLLFGFGYRRLSNRASQITTANQKFYVTFIVEKVRDFSLNAVQTGDMFYQQYGQQPLGSVTEVKKEQAREIIKDNATGQAAYVPMEDKYNMYITLECTGNVNDNGYFINGNVQISEGSDVRLQSNRILCGAKVSSIAVK